MMALPELHEYGDTSDRSTISKLEIQSMSFRRSVNNSFFHSFKHVKFRAKKGVFGGKFTALLYFEISQLKHTEFLLRLPATMLCRKQHAEFDLDASKIMILMLKIKRNAAEELEALLHEDSCQTLAELAESLGVDHTTVSKRLKEVGMIQSNVIESRTS
ncbi:hypothetical protein AVEN_198073-1 [Araneus ventricosus]|uniref:Uncharacterized protein n=1 Tax=Araneus ventricosus TaxID=182803 RepID=A0A4Y2UXW2_ARAVE|nr:hypothetical protein AVEN_198073-1 [Araneus ventricosus]